MEKQILKLELDKQMIKTNNLMHFILTLLTGVWGIVWVAVALNNKNKRAKIDTEITKIKLLELAK